MNTSKNLNGERASPAACRSVFICGPIEFRSGVYPYCVRFRKWRPVLADGLDLVGAANGLVLLLEAVNTSGGIDQLLLTREERVAARADFHADVALVGGSRLKDVTAGADDADFVVSGVNSGLHDITGGSFRNFSITKDETPMDPKAHGGR